jgi:hypothetical protein
MRNVPYTQALSQVRTLSGKITFRDTRLRFAEQAGAATLANCTSFDGDLSDSGTRIFVAGLNNTTLNYCRWNPSGALSWTSTAYTARANSKIGVYQDYMFLQDAAGAVRRLRYSGSWANVSTTTFATYPVAVAPITEDEFYILELVTVAGKPVSFFRLHYHKESTNTSATWAGRFYGENLTLDGFDAVRIGGVDHIYFTDQNGKRAWHISSEIGTKWGSVQMVLPLDVVDDVSQFRLKGATVIDSKVFLTGSLRRTEGTGMEIYMVGPEEVTLGRDLFVCPELSTPGGKLYLISDTLYYVSNGKLFTSPATTLVGYDAAAKKVEVTGLHGFSLSGAPNSSNSLYADLDSDLTHAALRPGAEAAVEIGVNGENSSLGVFGIDSVSRPQEMNGQSLNISGRGLGLKKLAQYQSDASYDHWSQTKLSSNPKDLTNVIRTQGSWGEVLEDLNFQELNDDGFLYMNAKAARGSLAVIKVQPRTGNWGFKIGVGVNYHYESKYEASKRLDKDVEEVTDAECGHNGIFAVHERTFAGASQLQLYWLQDNTWTAIGTPAAFDPPMDVYYYLLLKYVDGVVTCLVRGENTAAWTQLKAILLVGATSP